MATDLDDIVRNLTTFYDFSAKTAVAAGAGGARMNGLGVESKS